MRESVLALWDAVTSSGAGTLGWSTPEPPSTDRELAEAEKAMGRKLPTCLTQMLRRSRSWLWREAGFDAIIFQPPADIALDYRKPTMPMDEIIVSKSDSPRVKPFFYSSARITFAFSDYFKFQIDEEPTASGTVGQIVVVDMDAESIDVLADSLEAFVLRGIECLQRQLKGGYPAASSSR